MVAILTFFFCLVLPAQGATYAGTMFLDGTVPTNMDSGDIVGVMVQWDTELSESDTVITSSWSYITCGITDGSVWAKFEATVSNYPSTSSFPSTATCSASGESLVISITLTDDYEVMDYDMSDPPGQGYVVNLTEDFETVRSYHLQSNNYIEERQPAWLAPQVDWPGVFCVVGPNGSGHVLHITFADNAAENLGYCVVRTSTQNYHVDVTLNRIE